MATSVPDITESRCRIVCAKRATRVPQSPRLNSRFSFHEELGDEDEPHAMPPTAVRLGTRAQRDLILLQPFPASTFHLCRRTAVVAADGLPRQLDAVCTGLSSACCAP